MPQSQTHNLNFTSISRTRFDALPALLIGILFLSGCGSHPIKPAAESVKISRDAADSDCREIGSVEGRNKSAQGTFETALEDLKLDASRQGANFVKIEQSSGTGTAVRGTAYFCP